MEEGKGERYLASGRQYGNALLGVRHQEEEEDCAVSRTTIAWMSSSIVGSNGQTARLCLELSVSSYEKFCYHHQFQGTSDNKLSYCCDSRSYCMQ